MKSEFMYREHGTYIKKSTLQSISHTWRGVFVCMTLQNKMQEINYLSFK